MRLPAKKKKDEGNPPPVPSSSFFIGLSCLALHRDFDCLAETIGREA
jgi:hypothetical protein